jgi:hypothetical protein
MREVRETPGQLAYWQAAASGDLPDWGAVFEAFGCTVDWPSARYWREIAARYPEAKTPPDLPRARRARLGRSDRDDLQPYGVERVVCGHLDLGRLDINKVRAVPSDTPADHRA